MMDYKIWIGVFRVMVRYYLYIKNGCTNINRPYGDEVQYPDTSWMKPRDREPGSLSGTHRNHIKKDTVSVNVLFRWFDMFFIFKRGTI